MLLHPTKMGLEEEKRVCWFVAIDVDLILIMKAVFLLLREINILLFLSNVQWAAIFIRMIYTTFYKVNL